MSALLGTSVAHPRRVGEHRNERFRERSRPTATRRARVVAGTQTVERIALEQVLAGLASDHEAGQAPGAGVCKACATVVGTTSAGIMFKIGDQHYGSLGSSDARSAVIEELQFTLGEGPCVDAYSSGRPVAEPDLMNPSTPRWPAFSQAVLESGIRAVFAFPLRLGAIRLGALDLQCELAGDLDVDQRKAALVVADLVTNALLDLQAAVPGGRLAPEFADAETLRTEIHQASGMISALLDISIADALVRLRARAYAEDRPIRDVAHDVVTRRLRIE